MQRIDALLADVVSIVLKRSEPKAAPPHTIFTDGSCHPNPGPAGYGMLIQDGDGQVVHDASVPLGKATSNEAEYAGVINGLRTALSLGIDNALLKSDSQLVLKQINGEYKCKDDKLQLLLAEVRNLTKHFKKIRFTHVPGKDNPAHELAEAAYKQAKEED
jgi:ribonuclease HI